MQVHRNDATSQLLFGVCGSVDGCILVTRIEENKNVADESEVGFDFFYGSGICGERFSA